MLLLETIVCQTESGKESRFERMVKSRVELSKRQDGCKNSWYGKSKTDQFLFIIQSVYLDIESYHQTKSHIEKTLDSKDGGLESCLIGPPLLGMFEISDDSINMS